MNQTEPRTLHNLKLICGAAHAENRTPHRGHPVGFLSLRCPAVLAVVTARRSSHVVPVKKVVAE